jgi:prepilin-type N-terminal cleavage/methylation domain-containing protein
MNIAGVVRKSVGRGNSRGFGLVELLVVMVIIGILSVLATPSFMSYWRASILRAGAQELATAINLGRQLAITRNTTACVQLSGKNILVRIGGPPPALPCDGTIWTGPGTDGSGAIRLQSGLEVSQIGPPVVFTSLGAANAIVQYRVTNPVDNKFQIVLVSLSGRVSLPCPGCP